MPANKNCAAGTWPLGNLGCRHRCLLVKTVLQAPYPVWAFKDLKTGRGAVGGSLASIRLALQTVCTGLLSEKLLHFPALRRRSLRTPCYWRRFKHGHCTPCIISTQLVAWPCNQIMAGPQDVWTQIDSDRWNVSLEQWNRYSNVQETM